MVDPLVDSGCRGEPGLQLYAARGGVSNSVNGPPTGRLITIHIGKGALIMQARLGRQREQ